MSLILDKPKVIVIAGPTGIGKTSTAIAIVESCHGETIGADSMQVYRYMDIGTAKPTAEEQARITHHLIDVVDPDQPFDAAIYYKMAREQANQLILDGKIPIVAGGTGLYIRAFLNGLSGDAIKDNDVRERLRQAAGNKEGAAELHARLMRVDPQSADRIHPNDSFRIIRALEVYEITGRPLSSIQHSHQFQDAPYHAQMIGLTMARDRLYARINDRVEKMMASGFVNEVEQLLQKGYAPSLKSMQSLGYRHIVEWINGGKHLTATVEAIKRDTRRYAKRQLTWFKKETGTTWMAPDNQTSICTSVSRFLQDG